MQTSSRYNKAQQLLHTAHQYERIGDLYQAVKLYRTVIKLAPHLGNPYQQLSGIYKHRKEWKPTLYYSQQAIQRNSQNLDVWGNLATAATALVKWKIANQAIAKLSLSPFSSNRPIPIRIFTAAISEIVWAMPIRPLCAKIISIPHPNSGRRYGETVLYNWKSEGKRIVNARTQEVFVEIERLKKSYYRTFSVLIHTDRSEAIEKLAKLCQDQGLGFENWSNLHHQLAIPTEQRSAEYYDAPQSEESIGYQLIAIAALQRRSVRQVLRAWRIITLEEYSWLDEHD